MRLTIRIITIALILFPWTRSFGKSDILGDFSQLTRIAEGFQFTEGGARDDKGNIYFTDIPKNRIHKWNAKTNKITVFEDESNGANGCWIDDKGNLIVCEHGGRGIYQYDKNGKRTTVVNEYEGKKLNSPNDLWLDKRGGIYFSDPRYGRNRDDMEQDGEHVYYLTPNREKLIRVADDMVRPNGIVGTTDGLYLYIADQGGGKTWKYSIRRDGTLRNKKLFAEEGSDGVTLDHTGNLYLTNSAVRIYNSNGTLIEEIETPKPPSNVVFGGEKEDILFITARDSVYFIKTKVEGASVN